MESRVRHPLSHTRYYPSLDYGYEGRYSLPATRQPLQESTGNAHHGSLASSRSSSYNQHLDAFNLVRPSSIQPPILPTQAIPSSYHAPPPSSSYGRLQQQCGQHQQQHLYRKRNINPLCLSRQFQQYRTKQAQKEDKSDQTWPDVLEEAFLDALLLIPHMGRKKYGMNQKQCGRNMLITDYLWIAYCDSLPPGVMPDPKMKRHRKQVSSHIQVLKGFFRHHPMYHIFFSKEEKRDDKSRDAIETGSLKDHPVLRALAEGRLPDERPNYDYFAHLLAFESQITVKPKRCWIFVAHNDVAVRADGSGYNPATGDEVSGEDYPHMKENLVKDDWQPEDKAMLPGTLLHRFTKMLEQVESSSVREISSQWAVDFPELAARLEAATAPADGAEGQACCDILHMHLTLEMQRRRHFPAQSELNSWVEINIEQPRLLSHRWKVVTRLVRPAELSKGVGGGTNSATSGNNGTLYETSAEMGVSYMHQPQCPAPINGQPCDCISQSQRQAIGVPFPADVWARTLINCAEYPAHPLVLERPGGDVKAEHDEEEECHTKSRIKRHLTQMELVPKIAMFQELWSCAPGGGQDADIYGTSQDDPHRRGSSGGGGNGRWKRRAVLLWTFETVHSVSYTMRGKNELVTAPEGKGQWRFLTTLDPTSQYHQKQSLLSPAVARGSASMGGMSVVPSSTSATHGLPRDAVMSPTPTYHQQLTASMSENFALAWDPTSGGSIPAYPNAVFPGSQASHAGGAPSLYRPPPAATTVASAISGSQAALDPFASHGGLATPPPTASLGGSFTHSFGSTGGQQGPAPGDQALGFMSAVTTAGMDGVGGLAASDSFLGGDGGGGGYAGYDDVGVQGWDMAAAAAGLPAVDASRLVPSQWPVSRYGGPGEAMTATATGIDWAVAAAAAAAQPPPPPVARRDSCVSAASGMCKSDAEAVHRGGELGERSGWPGGRPTPGADAAEAAAVPVGSLMTSAGGNVDVGSGVAQECADSGGQQQQQQQQQQQHQQRLFGETQGAPVRHKSLKRSRDSLDDRENEPPHAAKMARYSVTSAAELDWDEVSGRGA